MSYVLRAPNGKGLEFEEYKDAIFALRPFRTALDGIVLEETDEDGNVLAVIENKELRQIVLQLDAIAFGTGSFPAE